MIRRWTLAVTWLAFWATSPVSSSLEKIPDQTGEINGHQNSTETTAAELLNEFAGEEDVASIMADYGSLTVPSVLISREREDCHHVSGASAEVSAGVGTFLHPPEETSTTPVVIVDETGRSFGPCPKSVLRKKAYYGSKAAVADMHGAQSISLGSVKQTVDLTRLGLDRQFNEKAYESLKVCNNLFFSGGEGMRNFSDPACVVAHLDEASLSIRTLDTASLRKLHPRLKAALVLASNLTLRRQKKEWIRKLTSSNTLHLAWHVVETFSAMNVSMLESNVGEALNSIVMKDLRLLQPLKDLIQFATTCTTYEEYPEKSWQDTVRFPSPDSPQYKTYPIYDYLRAVGADVSFPRIIPADWQPRVYDGNRMARRAIGERDSSNFSGDWKKRVYNSWHNLWVLHLVVHDAGSMWQWSQHLNASTFFFKPWKVTRVAALKVAEAGPLRYDDLSARFRVDPSIQDKNNEYASCPQHLVDTGFFDKVKAPRGRLTAQWGRMDLWKAIGLLGWNCPVSEVDVPCPPQIYPDKCGVDATYIRPVEAPWLFRLERESTWITWETDETQNDYVDRIWAARGTTFPKLWLLNTMWDTTSDPELSPSGEGKIHSGFLFAFRRIFKEMLNDDIREVSEKIHATGKRQVVLFTGHSLGGAVSQIGAWYYAVKSRSLIRQGLLQIRCVTFGAPAWGNEAAYNEFMSTGVIIHDIATSMDPVTTLNGEPELGHGLQWKKPFHYRIMLDDLKQVVVASTSPLEPDFDGRLWTRTDLHAGSFLKRTFGAFASMKNVDSVFLNPVLTHFLSYTAVLTIMADLVPEADFGSGLAAPLINDPPISYSAHSLCSALIAAQGKMRWVMTQLALEASREPKVI
ncbi:lipase domain-containing protein, putative [Eimeria tenella]|uniref:Lipase domain-containing protein, putative n=1 Tax=Eimeria tenella TaxID=5802 RepID=U6KVX1_EIMTE|nr:lipase domain-containing protein, putative [Eimeria tenella]CDJ39655.1 lipase domain-containing protein, putative [Eimeria tenella]|eukprot:XP_013230410.1 lipase domain-containing protein, putative [Eimeria tenella]